MMAIDVAHTEFKSFRITSPLVYLLAFKFIITFSQHRSGLIKKWHELIVRNEEALAQLLTLENGKTLREARAEIFQSIISDNFRCRSKCSCFIYRILRGRDKKN